MLPPSTVWSVDFEYSTDKNFRPIPICMVAREIFSGELRRVWLWDDPPSDCPIDFTGSLYVAYAASAEMGWLMEQEGVQLCPCKTTVDLERKGEIDRLKDCGLA